MELVDLRAKSKTDTKNIRDLTRERAVLTQKVKDRDEELKGKARFLEVFIFSVFLVLEARLHFSEYPR
jgi:hypothetical protein